MSRPKAESKNPKLSQLGDPSPAIEACATLLRGYFGISTLSFAREDRRDLTRCQLVGQGQELAEARDSYRIHLLPELADELYWVAITIDFKFVNPGYDLENVSIIVFRGMRSLPKTPVLRAEWHCSEQMLSADHAQPHWHVYLRDASAGASGSVAMKEIPFHFAMCSRWQFGDASSHRNRLTDVAELNHWISGCISYIRTQITTVGYGLGV